MSKAEKFIQDYTRNCFNYNSYAQDPIPWLTPDDAKSAVEVAKEEMIEKVCEYIASNMRCDGYTLQTKSKFIKNLKQAMKDEMP